jgi:hypothetical protein
VTLNLDSPLYSDPPQVVSTFPGEQPAEIPGQLALTRLYTCKGTNSLRGVTFTEYVEATSAGEAVRIADERRLRNNKIRAESWRTTPGF